MRLTSTGIVTDLDISDSAPPIPSDVTAAVADLSAVGEQYVDLRPKTGTGPFLAGGSVSQTSYGGAMFAVTAVHRGGRWLIENIDTFTSRA